MLLYTTTKSLYSSLRSSQFQPTDLDGRLTVSCIEAKGLHPSSTWFDSFKNEDSKTRNKTLVFAPIPQLATLSASSNAMIEEIEVGENTSRRSSVSLQSPLQSPRDGSGSANPLASMATTSIAKRLATKGKQYVEEAADVSDRLHYSEPIKQLEGLRNAFLRRLKTAPRKCSSDTQPKCWDRLPKGVKIEEAYFSEKPPTRKPLALLKQKHKDQDSNITNVTNSPSKALQKAAEKEEAREWIADTLAPQIFEEMIDSVFTIRNFRLGVEKNSNGWDRGGTSVRGGSARSCASTIRGGKAVDEFERKMEEEIENAELIYQRYTPIKILDLDMLSGQKAQKSDAIDLAAAWFRWIDKDDSGKISFREFSDCITEVDLMFSKADTYLLMQRFKIEDEDGADDNMIRYKDFLTWAEGAVKGKITKVRRSEESSDSKNPHTHLNNTTSSTRRFAPRPVIAERGSHLHPHNHRPDRNGQRDRAEVHNLHHHHAQVRPGFPPSCPRNAARHGMQDQPQLSLPPNALFQRGRGRLQYLY